MCRALHRSRRDALIADGGTPEPTYPKPDISVRATTLYFRIAAPLLLPFVERRLLNLFRCREGKCFFQRNREHPPTARNSTGW